MMPLREPRRRREHFAPDVPGARVYGETWHYPRLEVAVIRGEAALMAAGRSIAARKLLAIARQQEAELEPDEGRERREGPLASAARWMELERTIAGALLMFNYDLTPGEAASLVRAGGRSATRRVGEAFDAAALRAEIAARAASN